jgi:nucleoside-diphosphate-sugar epimerase
VISRRAVRLANETVALIAGVAGFIGSHLTDALLARGWRVVIDNFQTGRFDVRHLERESRFDLLEADVIDCQRSSRALATRSTIGHLEKYPLMV